MNWFYLILILALTVVLVLRAADSETFGRFGPVGQMVQRIASYRENRYREVVAAEVDAALDRVLPKMVFEGYEQRERPDDVVRWLVDLETENRAARSFILADARRRELWLEFFAEWRRQVAL